MEKPAQIKLDLVNTKNGSAARVTFYKTTAGIAIPRPVVAEARGMSKRHPKDTPNSEIGELLAVGRALEELSRKLIEQAERKVGVGGRTTIEDMVKASYLGRPIDYLDLISDV
jgi:hypothetical protein